MMRTIWALWISLWILNGMSAQSKVKIGLAYAPTLAGIGELSTKTKDHWYGQQALLYLYWNTQKRISYRVGLGYSFTQAEYRFSAPNLGENITTRFKHFDLILPFQAQYALTAHRSRPYLALGMTHSLNIGRRVSEIRNDLSSPISIRRDITKFQYYKYLDGLISAGVGYEYQWKDGSILYVQPNYRTNYITQLIYLVKYFVDGHYYSSMDPPDVHTFGIELGWFFR